MRGEQFINRANFMIGRLRFYIYFKRNEQYFESDAQHKMLLLYERVMSI